MIKAIYKEEFIWVSNFRELESMEAEQGMAAEAGS